MITLYHHTKKCTTSMEYIIKVYRDLYLSKTFYCIMIFICFFFFTVSSWVVSHLLFGDLFTHSLINLYILSFRIVYLMNMCTRYYNLESIKSLKLVVSMYLTPHSFLYLSLVWRICCNQATNMDTLLLLKFML